MLCYGLFGYFFFSLCHSAVRVAVSLSSAGFRDGFFGLCCAPSITLFTSQCFFPLLSIVLFPVSAMHLGILKEMESDPDEEVIYVNFITVM